MWRSIYLSLVFTGLLIAQASPVFCQADKPLRGYIKSQAAGRLPRPQPAAKLNDSLEISGLLGSSLPELHGQLSGQSPLTGGAIKDQDFWLPKLNLEVPREAPLTPPRISSRRQFDDNYWAESFILRRGSLPGGWPQQALIDTSWSRYFHSRSEASGIITFPQAHGSLMPRRPALDAWPALPNSGQPLVALSDPPAVSLDETIFWNDWYKKVAAAIYSSWSTQKKSAGSAHVRIDVTRSRHASLTIYDTTSNAATFRQSLVNAVAALNDTETLAFPTRSRRGSVSFEANFTTGSDNTPGVTVADENDSESIRVRPQRHK